MAPRCSPRGESGQPDRGPPWPARRHGRLHPARHLRGRYRRIRDRRSRYAVGNAPPGRLPRSVRPLLVCRRQDLRLPRDGALRRAADARHRLPVPALSTETGRGWSRSTSAVSTSAAASPSTSRWAVRAGLGAGVRDGGGDLRRPPVDLLDQRWEVGLGCQLIDATARQAVAVGDLPPPDDALEALRIRPAACVISRSSSAAVTSALVPRQARVGGHRGWHGRRSGGCRCSRSTSGLPDCCRRAHAPSYERCSPRSLAPW
jgi:hypothetical protein